MSNLFQRCCMMPTNPKDYVTTFHRSGVVFAIQIGLGAMAVPPWTSTNYCTLQFAWCIIFAVFCRKSSTRWVPHIIINCARISRHCQAILCNSIIHSEITVISIAFVPMEVFKVNSLILVLHLQSGNAFCSGQANTYQPSYQNHIHILVHTRSKFTDPSNLCSTIHPPPLTLMLQYTGNAVWLSGLIM